MCTCILRSAYCCNGTARDLVGVTQQKFNLCCIGRSRPAVDDDIVAISPVRGKRRSSSSEVFKIAGVL